MASAAAAAEEEEKAQEESKFKSQYKFLKRKLQNLIYVRNSMGIVIYIIIFNF